MQQICFNQNLFLISILTCFIIIIVFTNMNSYQTKSNNSNKTNDDDDTLISNKYIIPTSDFVNDKIDKRDEDALENPLKAPNRRLPRHIYPSAAKDYIFEVPTRGYPDNYHYYGNLIRREDDKIVKLFGRQIYPGSNQYEYYGITSDPTGGSSVKIPIKVRGDKELYDKDEIDIDFLDSSVGKFILFMNDFDRPRYNPFVIN